MVGRHPGSPKGSPRKDQAGEFGHDDLTVAAAPDFASTVPTVQEFIPPEQLLEEPEEPAQAVEPASAAVVPESDFVHDRPTVARDVDALAAQVDIALDFETSARTVAVRGVAEKTPRHPDATPGVEILESPGVYRMKRPPIVDDITTPLPARTPTPVEPKVRLGLPKKSP